MLTWLERILGVVMQILGIVSNAAQEHAAYNVETYAYDAKRDSSFALADLRDPTTGLAAILAAINGVGATTTNVYNIVNNYTTPGGGGTPDDVWAYYLTGKDESVGNLSRSAGSLLSELVWWATTLAGKQGVSDERNPYVRLVVANLDYFYFPYDGWSSGTRFPIPPVPDLTLVQPGDDPLTFLQRVQPLQGWQSTGPDGSSGGGPAWVHETGSGYDIWWKACLPGSAFYTAARSNEPPVWPGLAAVTLGTPVALSTGVTITAPMDGVLVALTSWPMPPSGYDFDGNLSHVHLGALAFFSDNGDIELAQSFSFENHIVVPKTMRRAAGCYVRAKPSVSGTLTPWTIT